MNTNLLCGKPPKIPQLGKCFSDHFNLRSTVYSSVAQLCLTLPTPWTAACQAYLSITNSRSLLKLMSIESVVQSNHLVLCCPLLLPSVFPSESVRVFSGESVFRFRWQKYWSFSFSIRPSSEYSGLISFRIHWYHLLALQESSPTP